MVSRVEYELEIITQYKRASAGYQNEIAGGKIGVMTPLLELI